MKNFIKYFKIVIAVGALLSIFGLTGCENEEDMAEFADSGTSTETSTVEPLSTISVENPVFDIETETTSSIFETSELGVLLRAPDGTSVKPDGKMKGAENALASAILQHDTSTYTVLVYEKREGEVLQEWMKRSEVGDAYLSPETLRTANGRTAFIYETNDLGLLPAVHATVATDRFVYYLRWDDGLPDDPVLATQIYRENPEAYEVPEEFRQFIREIELQ